MVMFAAEADAVSAAPALIVASLQQSPATHTTTFTQSLPVGLGAFNTYFTISLL